MVTQSERVSFIWGIADLIRDVFKRGKFQDVILPFTVLRRIDCVIAPTKAKVMDVSKKLKEKGLKKLDDQLCRASGFAFYNTSKYDFERLLDDPSHIAHNLRNYIAGFSPNMQEVLERFGFEGTIKNLDEKGLLFKVMERFAAVDLHTDKVSNHDMGLVFEELVRKFNEALDENPGEHFTPREIVRLMADLLLAGDKGLEKPGTIRTVFDPCCGSGGMLSIAKERILESNKAAKVYLFGQEVNPETFAVCKADMFMKSQDGKDAENIIYGSTLREDKFPTKNFVYLIANPPYGKDWEQDREYVEAEYEKGDRGRLPAGLPSKSDGQMLFLEVMLSKMRDPKEGLSRVAIVMNGSPLFMGEAGSGPSEIRRWILEKDYLETLIALPDQMFYNTGISTYIWVLSNRKEDKRKGKVQLINATGEGFYKGMRKSLGNKRHELSQEHIEKILKLYRDFTPSEYIKIFDNEDFGYHRVMVERPLRLNFQASPERIERLRQETAFEKMAGTKKKGRAGETEIEDGRRLQGLLLKILGSMNPNKVHKNRPEFEKDLDAVLEQSGEKWKAPVRKVILSALGERDESAEICKDSDGKLEPDSELRDYENIPLKEGIQVYFKREVLPHVPDAWIDESKTKIGYEIPFTRHFYKYTPLRPLEVIEAEIKKLEEEIALGLKDLNK